MTLAEVSTRGQEAIQELLACIREGYTGDLQFHFSDGEPKLVKRVERRELNGDSFDGARTEAYK